jgi:hypothetical protein
MQSRTNPHRRRQAIANSAYPNAVPLDSVADSAQTCAAINAKQRLARVAVPLNLSPCHHDKDWKTSLTHALPISAEHISNRDEQMVFPLSFLHNKNHLLLRYGIGCGNSVRCTPFSALDASAVRSTGRKCGNCNTRSRWPSQALSTPVCLATCVAMASMSGGERQS